MMNPTGSPDIAKESWPLANWVAPRVVLVPCGMGAFLFVSHAKAIWVVPRERMTRPKRMNHPYFSDTYGRRKRRYQIREMATSYDPCGHKRSVVSTCWSRRTLVVRRRIINTPRSHD